MTKLIIVEGGNLVEEAARLKDMYTGLFSVARIKYAEERAKALDTQWLIFSANHGLMTPNIKGIKPYTQRFDAMTEEQCEMMARRVGRKLRDCAEQTHIELHGSDHAHSILLAAIEHEGLSIGVTQMLSGVHRVEQRAFYQEAIDAKTFAASDEMPPERSWDELNITEQMIVWGFATGLYDTELGNYFASQNKQGDAAVCELLKVINEPSSAVGVKVHRQQLWGDDLSTLPSQWLTHCDADHQPGTKTTSFPKQWDELTIEQQIVAYGCQQRFYGFDTNRGDADLAKWATSQGKPLLKAQIAHARKSMYQGNTQKIGEVFSHQCKWATEGVPWEKRKKEEVIKAQPTEQVDLLGGPQPIETTPKATDIVVGEQPPEGVVILSAEEDALLNRLEDTIQEGMQTFRQVGQALAEIREKGLWRAYGYETFREYLDVRWNLGKTYAYNLMKAAEIAGELEDQGIEPPKTEAGVRELAKAPKEERAEVLQETRERTGKEEPTAKEIKETIDAKNEGREPNDSRSPIIENWRDTYGTPARIASIGRRAVGGEFDVDPATNLEAQKVIQARTFYTIETNGLEQEWNGTFWLNFPYSNPAPWVDKTYEEFEAERAEAGVVLSNTDNSTQWWCMLADAARWVAMPSERIWFWLNTPTNEQKNNRYSQTMFFLGDVVDEEVTRLREQDWRVFRSQDLLKIGK